MVQPRAVGEEAEASSEKEGHVASRDLVAFKCLATRFQNACPLYLLHTDAPSAVVTDDRAHLVTISETLGMQIS